jgi:lipoprotein signal peptidase
MAVDSMRIRGPAALERPPAATVAVSSVMRRLVGRSPALAAAAAVGCVTVVLDQATKSAVTAGWAGSRQGALIPVHNRGLSLGTLHASASTLVAIMVVGLIALGVVVLGGAARGEVPPWVAGVTLGGACSNLSDRVVTGAVRDVFAVQRVVLNLADLALVAGVVGWLVCTSGRRRVRVSASGLEVDG